MSCCSASEDTLEPISNISIWKGVNGWEGTVTVLIVLILYGAKVIEKNETDK
jgi:hypothetical protein